MADTVAERVRRYRSNKKEADRVALHADIQQLRKEQLVYLAKIHDLTLKEMLELVIQQAYEAEQKQIKSMLFKEFEKAYEEGRLSAAEEPLTVNRIAKELQLDVVEVRADYMEWRGMKLKKLERAKKKELLGSADRAPQVGQT